MIRPQPKPTRHVEKPYRDWIKTLQCTIMKYRPDVALCVGAIDPAHMVAPGQGRLSSKVSDKRCLPMCRTHHIVCPNVRALRAQYSIDAEAEIKRLNADYRFEHPGVKPKKARVVKHRLVIECGECREYHKTTCLGSTHVGYCPKVRKNVEL